jgi:hypothetical protein
MIWFGSVNECLMSTANPLQDLAQFLARYDPIDVAATAGGLQLIPENAGRYLVLPALAHAVATLPVDANKPKLSASNLRKLLRTEPLGKGSLVLAEDPFEFSFTESIAFKGGAYTVFPGNGVESTTFILRHIFQAIDAIGDSKYDNFCREATSLAHAALTLIDAVAERAGLTYGVEPASEFRDPVVIPNSSKLAGLKESVTFSTLELSALLTAVDLNITAIERLVLPFGSITLDSYRLGDGPAVACPVLFSGEEYVVVNPENVASALRHQIVCLAIEHGVHDYFAGRYHTAVWQTVVDTFEYMRQNLVLATDDDSTPSWLSEGLFSLDRDKLAYVALITDPLDVYDPNEVFGYWEAPVIERIMNNRLMSIQHDVLGSANPPNEILSVFLSAGFGRAVMVGSNGGDSAIDAPLVGFAVSDLETIAEIENGERLAVWKFAKAYQNVRKTTTIAPTSMLNEYSYFRSNNYSYYLSDDATPNTIVLGEGGAGRLRTEVVPKRNWHAVESYRPNEAVEVGTMHHTVAFPEYGPRSILKGNYEVILEGVPIPIWILNAESIDRESPFFGVGINFVELIAYWLWQFTPSLAKFLNHVAQRYACIVIRLNITSDEAWFKRASAESNSPAELLATLDLEEGILDLEPQPGILRQFYSADNAGEREFMRAVLGHIAQLTIADHKPLTDDAISTLIETHAPLGRKKKMFLIVPDGEPPLDPGNLPSVRKLQEQEESDLLDRLGRHLRQETRLSIGPIRDDERNTVLREVVDFYYRRLQRIVATLDPTDLLERLISRHEAIVNSSATHKMQMPTRLAAFENVPEMVEIIKGELQDDTNAALASRFVIEYVAARPPMGLRPLSIDLYDHLQAIANHLINFGFESDLIYFSLADLKLSVLPSGRLRVERDLFTKARAEYLDALTSGRIARSIRRFAGDVEEMMTRGTGEPSEKPDWAVQLDEAALAEFGYTLTDIGKVMMQAVRIGQDSESQVLVMDSQEVHSAIAANLDCPNEKVAGIVELLSLRERRDFLIPPSPHSKWSVLPWRFNRSYSYVRRPFLLRGAGAKTEVLWGFRHVYDAWINLVSLTLNGRLECKSPQMRKLMGEANNDSGEAFNQLVAEELAKNGKLIVAKKVTRFEDLQLPAEFGDIDVLVIDSRRKRLIPIECKDLSVGRTAHDMANEIQSLFHGHAHKKSYVEKHERRVTWLKTSIDDVLRTFGIDSTKRWRTEPLIVVSRELMTPYLHRSPIRVISYEDLMNEKQKWG